MRLGEFQMSGVVILQNASQRKSVFEKFHRAVTIVKATVQAMTLTIFFQLTEKRIVWFNANPTPAERFLKHQRVVEANAVRSA